MQGNDHQSAATFDQWLVNANILILAAHPDDETIACSGLLQRTTNSLVVFATDGAPPQYRFEKKFRSLQQYSDMRFEEASTALACIPHSSFRRLARRDGTWFVDQHLFLDLPEACVSLLRIARDFSPDTIVSHAFEGGHIDHDACHFLAQRAANSLNIPALEFPLYWKADDGRDIFQRFREQRTDEFALTLSPQEISVKQQMLAKYRTQQSLTHVFAQQSERFRPMHPPDHGAPPWKTYPFENRRKQLKVEFFMQKIADFAKTEILPGAPSFQEK